MITSKLRFLIPAVVLLAFAGGFMDAAKRKTLTQKEKFEIAIQGIAKKKALKTAQKEAQIRQLIDLFDSGPKALTETDMVDVLSKFKADAVVDKIVKELTPAPADPIDAFIQDVAKLTKDNVVAGLPKIVKKDAGDFKLVKDGLIKIEGGFKDNLESKLQEISVARIKDLIDAVARKGKKANTPDRLIGILTYEDLPDKEAILKKAADELKFDVTGGQYSVVLTAEQLKVLNTYAVTKAKKITEDKATSVTASNNEIKAVKEALQKFVTAQEKIVTEATDKAVAAKPKIDISLALKQDFTDARDGLTPEIGKIKFNKTKLKEVQEEHARVTVVDFLAVEKKAVSDAAEAISEFVDQEIAKQGGGAPVAGDKVVITYAFASDDVPTYSANQTKEVALSTKDSTQIAKLIFGELSTILKQFVTSNPNSLASDNGVESDDASIKGYVKELDKDGSEKAVASNFVKIKLEISGAGLPDVTTLVSELKKIAI